MTTLHDRSARPFLLQDMAAYRQAYRAYARFVIGWGFSAYAFPGSFLWADLQALRRDVLEDMK